MMISVLRWIWEWTVLLTAAWALTRLCWEGARRFRAAGPSRHWLRLTQLALLFALAAPLLPLRSPGGWSGPSAQIWAPGRGSPRGAVAMLSAGAPRTGARTTAGVALRSDALAGLLALLAALSAGAVCVFVARVLRLRRQLTSLPVIRRVGHVAIAVSDEDPVPYSVYLPCHGTRAWVVVPVALLHQRPGLGISIRHELQHHRSGDTLWAPTMEAFRSLFFWSPAAHALARWTAELQEYACDEFLVGHRKIPLQAYGRCLVEVAQSALDSRPVPAGAAGMAGRPGSHLKRRIEMLMGQRKHTGQALFAAAAAGILILLAGAAFASQSAVQDRRITLAEAQAMALNASKDSAFPIVVNESVLAQLNRMLGTPSGREYVRNALSRMPAYRPGIEARFSRSELPLELLAVPIIESGYLNQASTSTDPSLAPGNRGAGIWMFIAKTARHFGLKVTPQMDQRLDVEKETDAAARYLGSLYLLFQDWGLALAAYNEGESHVLDVIERTGVRDPWQLIQRKELQPYAAMVMAGVLILKNPSVVQ